MAGANGDRDVVNGTLPLTPAQRGMWFAENLSPDYSVNIAQYLDIRHDPGGLDVDLLAGVCEEVGKQIESPFVRLTEVDGVPMQYVDVDFDQHVEIKDLRGEADPVATALAWMNTEYRQPVDLLSDQFVVIVLIRVADDRTFWYQRSHHIIVDGYAALTVVQRIVDRYNALRRGEEPVSRPAADMAEIVEYEKAYQSSGRRETDRKHWLSRVQDLPERVTLARVSGNAPLSFDNVVAGGALDPVLQVRLETVAKECGSSMAVVLTAAFAAFLSRMSGADDIVMSLPVTGRSTAKIKRSGGMLSNILPVRVRDVSTRTVRDLVAAAQLELTGALRHQRYRSDDIKRDADMDGSSVGFGPRINMVFFDEPIEIEGASVDYRILTSGILEDLLINLYQASKGAELVVDLHGNPHLYSIEEISTHHRRFLAFVGRLLDDLDADVIDVDILLPGESADLTELATGAERQWTDRQFSPDGLLGLFSARVAEHPDRVAISDDTHDWTYAQFDGLRRELAAHLADDGVRPADRVAVVLDRGIEQVAAIYAVLTVGGAYVPIDPASPDGRRSLVLETAQPALVIDTDYLTKVGLQADPAAYGSDPVEVTSPALPLGANAYVIFTSGSTGVPKGVGVPVAGVANRLAWMQDRYPIDAGDSVLYKTPFTFDVSVWELFWPLQVGARMVIARAGGHRDPEYLRTVLSAKSVTNVHFVPSMLDVFVDAVEPGTQILPPGVRRVFTSGEGLPAPLARRVVAESDVRLINLYGPTEASVEVTGYEVNGDEHAIPIGAPVPNTRTYVLDARLRQVPVGVAGELYLAGAQLADGYVNQESLTADRFVADPFVSGERMYRTGDLVRWNADGDLDYLGRTDFQVKIRGQRVELGEIEATLLGEGRVDSAVVVVRTDLGAPTLVAYVRPNPWTTVDEDLSASLLRWCRRHLPRYMVPAVVVVLDEFPVNSSGKLDRSALPDPMFTTDDSVPFVEPTTPTQLRLVSLLSELLDVERIGLRDNIFSLGADSLTAARLAARVRKEFGSAVALNEVFDSVDIGELAAAIDNAERADDRPPLRAALRPERIPLSYPQTRLWFINRMDPSAATYNMPGAVRLGSDVDIDAMRSAVTDVVTRHESLRTRFPAVDGEPLQEIVPVEAAVAETALSVRKVSSAELDSALSTEVMVGFDVATQLPVRFLVLQVVEAGVVTDNVLAIVLHHIAGDGASLEPLITDLMTAYASRLAGQVPLWLPLPVQYADYALWQRDVLGAPDDETSRLNKELVFWADELAGAPELLSLPADHPRPHIPTGVGAFVDTVLDGTTAAGVRALARAHDVTPFTVLHAALAAVFSRLGDSGDISIGTAVAGRDEPETAALIGMFVNTVVLRTQVRPGQTVAGFLREAGRVRTRALEHSQAPFEQVVDAVATHRTLAHSPLVQAIFTMTTDHHRALRTEGVEVLDARVPAAKYDLSVSAVQFRDDGTDGAGAESDRIELEFSYSTDLFERSTVERIAAYLAATIEAMIADPGRPLGSIDILPAGEITALTGHAPGATPGTLREFVIGALAAADAQRSAVTGATTVSNELFDMQSNQLARELLAVGLGPGDVVALSIPRSHLSVIAAVAVIKTGAAFVSIDPEFPADRRETMLADSRSAIGITTTATGAAGAGGLDWIVLDDSVCELRLAGHRETPIDDAELRRLPLPDDPAYLIYTSGSTGTPKATVVPNRGLQNLAERCVEIFGVTRSSRVLHVVSTSFDVWIAELLMALSTDEPFVVADRYTYGGQELEALIAAHEATHVVMTPSALSTVAPEQVPSVQVVVSCGEPCSPDLVRTWTDAGRRFYNAYGPTEATVFATYIGPMTTTEEVTIGRAPAGIGAMVLDVGLRPTPTGVIGELYLTGDQVVLGYLNRMQLTAERFVADPFGSGTRMYRTGDRVRRLADGRLVYHGRGDFQMKVRGMRVEPGEVDAVLNTYPGVANSLSMGVPGPAGATVLVSYVTPVKGSTLFPDDVIDFAAQSLPSHMVPQSVVVVDEFALTPVGKIDRSKLPTADFTRVTDFVAPRTQLESVIADVFAQTLGLERVSVHDGFFELGGNSLSATKLAAALSNVIGRPVPVKTLFEAPSVAGMSEAIGTLTAGHIMPPLVARQRAELVPVSDAQRGMWLLNRADPDSAAYNIAFALRLVGDLDLGALRAAAGDLIRRQEVLRTSYPMIDGMPTQVIRPADEVVAGLELTPIDVRGPLNAAIAEITGKGFDVVTAPPMRLALLRVGPAEHVMVFVIHHIGGDGSSLGPLARDFMAAYSARAAGHAPSWQPLRVQYADYVQWQAERLAMRDDDGVPERDRQMAYWKHRLAGAPERLDLPSDRPRPAVPTFGGARVGFEIPARLVNALEGIARARNTTLFMVTHAALAILLTRLSGRNDVVIGTPYAGRSMPALDDIVGMFVNTLALRTEIDPAEPFSGLIERVRSNDLADMAHTDVSFESVVAELGIARSASFNPVFQAMFAFQNLEFPVVELAGLEISPLSEELVAAKVDLQLTLLPGDAGVTDHGAPMRGEFVYATDLFDEATIDRHARRYLRVLEEICADPQIVVGDISIATDEERAAAGTSAQEDQPLPALVAAAALRSPDGTALSRDGVTVTFQALAEMTAAMSAALPDPDSAFVTALMSLAQSLAGGDAEELGDALEEIRRRAAGGREMDQGNVV